MPIIGPGAAGGGSGSGAISAATATLTNAQVLALPTTPVQVIAAPGSGLLLFPIAGVLSLTWVADYTNIDATAEIFVGWPNASHLSFEGLALSEAVASDVSGLLGFGEGGIGVALFQQRAPGTGATFGAAGIDDPPVMVDQPISIFAINGALGNFTGGNAGNSLSVTVFYATVTV